MKEKLFLASSYCLSKNPLVIKLYYASSLLRSMGTLKKTTFICLCFLSYIYSQHPLLMSYQSLYPSHSLRYRRNSKQNTFFLQSSYWLPSPLCPLLYIFQQQWSRLHIHSNAKTFFSIHSITFNSSH